MTLSKQEEKWIVKERWYLVYLSFKLKAFIEKINYRIVIERVWSDNKWLPKARIVKCNLNGLYYPSLPTNAYKDFAYRLRLSVVEKWKIQK